MTNLTISPVAAVQSKNESTQIITAKHKIILRNIPGLEEGEKFPEQSFVDDLGADSIEVVELKISPEAAFEFEMPTENMGKFNTAGQSIQYLVYRLTRRVLPTQV